jgi:hypothetical protein
VQFQRLIKRQPAFIPAYVHLFHIAACERRFVDAEDSIIAAIRENPFQVHRMLEPALSMIDQNRLDEVCTL